MSGTHRGYILEFPLIRIDCFTQINPPLPPSLLPAPNALLYLLTHVHTDHLQGLSKSSFNGKIVCSRETKEMLIRLETAAGRRLKAAGMVDRNLKIYGNLKDSRIERTIDLKRAGGLSGPMNVLVDRFTVIPYDEPQLFNLGKETVQITMIPANHCPGSSMFLITSSTKAILHTGDIRADLPYLSKLRIHPILREFVWDVGGFFDVDARVDIVDGKRRLDRIYLDTGMLIGTGDMPPRDEAIESLISTMKIYPENTRFYISCWTWGYEQVLKAINLAFNEKIYVDEYKGQIYYAIGTVDPHLKSIITNDMKSRFHACDHVIRCQTCRKGKGKIVEIHWAEVMVAAFPVKHQRVVEACLRAKEGKGEWPRYLISPVARHSPLPELQALVRLFRPTTISPNTLLDQTYGTDYYVMIGMFRECLGPGGADILEREATSFALEKLSKSKITGGMIPEKWEVESWARRLFGLKEGDEMTSETLGKIFGIELEQEHYGEDFTGGRGGGVDIEDSGIDLGASVHTNPTRHLREEYIDPQKHQAALEIISAEWAEYVETTGNYIDLQGFAEMLGVKLSIGTKVEVGSGRKENKKIQVGAFLESVVSSPLLGRNGIKQDKGGNDVKEVVIESKTSGTNLVAMNPTRQDVDIIDLTSQGDVGVEADILNMETTELETINKRKTMFASTDGCVVTGDQSNDDDLVKTERLKFQTCNDDGGGGGGGGGGKRVKTAHTGDCGAEYECPVGDGVDVDVDVCGINTDAKEMMNDDVIVGFIDSRSHKLEHSFAVPTPTSTPIDCTLHRLVMPCSSSGKQSSSGQTTPGRLALTPGTKELIAKMKRMREGEREGERDGETEG